MGVCRPYLTLMTEAAPQRHHDLREVFFALCWLVHTGAPWRSLPNDLPPWPAVYRQTRRWVVARLHFLAFVSLMLHRRVHVIAQSP